MPDVHSPKPLVDRAYQGGDDHVKLRGMFDFLPFDPGDFGFDLSNREIAALGYTTAFLAWAAIVTRRSVEPLLRAFLAPKILAVFVAMTLYVVASVALLAVVHLWDWPNLKTTLVWWMTFGCTTMFQAHRMAGERGAFRKLLRDAVNWTAVILFIAEFGSFALWVELIMLPVLTLIALLLAVAPGQPNASIIIKPLTSLQNTAGWIILAGSLWHIAANFSEFATLNSLREFGDPILLTLLYVPFLYVLAAMMTHEMTFTSLRIRTKDEAGPLCRTQGDPRFRPGQRRLKASHPQHDVERHRRPQGCRCGHSRDQAPQVGREESASLGGGGRLVSLRGRRVSRRVRHRCQ